MPKAGSKKATSAARKPAPQPTRTAARPAPSKAAQAAAHQGRVMPQGGAPTAPPEYPRAQVPARRPEASLPSAAVNSLPAFMRGDADIGKENINTQDMEIPRLKLMQGLSPELQEYDELRAGHFFHPAAEFIFNEPFRAVPVYMDKRYILWRPRDDGGGIIARADDGVHWSPAGGEFTVKLDRKDGGNTVTWKLAPTVQQSGLANWGTLDPDDPNSPPAATLMYNYLLAFPDEPDLLPAVLSFQRSSIKMGRRFNTKLKTVRAPLFGTVWEFKSIVDSNSRNEDFYNIDVRSAGRIEDEALYNQYRAMYETFSHKGLSIKDIETLQDDDPADAGNEPEATADAPTHQRF